MRQRYKGGIITSTEVDPTATVASGVWGLTDTRLNAPNNTWPTIPDAPTIGTVALSGGNGASVPFTTNNVHGASYSSTTVTSNCGSHTASGAGSPLTVTGLTVGQAYTFTATSTSNVGTSVASSTSNSVTATVPTGQNEFLSAGSYTWTAPACVTKISVIALGAGSNGGIGGGASSGGGGGGGGLAYVNDITVSPGTAYAVVVGNRGSSGYCMSGTNSTFNNSTVVAGGSSHTNRHYGGSGGSAVTGTGASFSAGNSMTYATPFAFKKKRKKEN